MPFAALMNVSRDEILILSLGYVRFTTERRDILKNEFPEFSVLEVTKKLADEWNTMSEENKKPYLDAADKDKDRYGHSYVHHQ